MHLIGYVEFFLCDRANGESTASELENCLVPVEIAPSSGSGYKWYLPGVGQSQNSNGGFWYDVDIKLPQGISGDKCLLKVNAHKNWKFQKLEIEQNKSARTK